MGIRQIANLLLSPDGTIRHEGTIKDFVAAGAISRVEHRRRIRSWIRQGLLSRRWDGIRYFYSLTNGGVKRLLWYRENGYFDE